MKKSIVLLLLATGCATWYRPGIELRDVAFTVFPHIEVADSSTYLSYQITIPQNHIENRPQVMGRRINERYYVFFLGRTSFREYGNLKRIPLNGLYDQPIPANLQEVYWLNPDGTEVPLEVTGK